MSTYQLFDACRNADMELVKVLFENNNITWDWNIALHGACSGGHLHLVETSIQKGANDWNGAMHEGCFHGHLHIVEFMIAKGANNWNGVLQDACHGGNKKIVELIISKGATNYDDGMLGACRGKHLSLVKLMIKLGARDFNNGLQLACIYESLDIMKLMIENGANDIECVTNENAFTLLEMGLSISAFVGNSRHAQLISDIQSFQHITIVNYNQYLIPDLTNLVASYSLK